MRTNRDPKSPQPGPSRNHEGIVMANDQVTIRQLEEGDQEAVCQLIRTNLEPFQEAGSVLASTFRRLESLSRIYLAEGSAFYVIIDNKTQSIVGGAGLGPLHGLPPSEGVGEVRDLVIDPDYRGLGHGKKLLLMCLDEAKKCGYQRIYLETTPDMQLAERLFRRVGFRPVKDQAKSESKGPIASYFLLELQEPVASA